MADAARDNNRVTTLLAVSNIDNLTPVKVWADPVTHALLISGSISATNPSVGTNTATAPTSSTEIGYIDGSGNLQGVSAINPLPVSASFSPSGTQDVSITKYGGVATTLGQKAMTASIPVVLASDQASIPVAATLSAETTKVIGTINISAAQTLATVTTVSTVTTLSQFAGNGINLGNGAVGTGTLRVTLANDSTGIVSLTTSAATIGKLAANSGVDIGDVDVTTVGTITPGVAAPNLGKAEDAAHASGDTGVAVWGVRNDNLATTYGADQDYGPFATDKNGRVQVSQKAATGTLSNVSTSGTSATLLAANSARIGATITNDAATVLYVKFGATASATSYTVTLAGAASAPFSYYEVPAGYTGIIDGILASSTGTARVTEIT